MKYRSAFDIIGPIMVGPSSSHTAGAARIGRLARSLFAGKPTKAIITFYSSFAKTYKGHGTDVAIVGGLLDFNTYDERIPQSLSLAMREGIDIEFIVEETIVTDHPNTVRVNLSNSEKDLELVGISIGGGAIEITELNSFKLKLTGECPAILVVNQDQFGVITAVTRVLADHQLNIGHMEVTRKEVGKTAIMVIEVDQKIEDDVIKELEKIQNVSHIIRMAG